MKILSYIIAILLFSIIIIFHELGHFLLAKANGIQVNEFSLGFGPTLVGFTKGGTKFSIKLIPFGGACMMEGEDEIYDDEEEKPEVEKTSEAEETLEVEKASEIKETAEVDHDPKTSKSFSDKSVWARMSVVFAGPFFNFIMAFIFSLIVVFSTGYDQPVLTDVTEGYPAQEAGLQAGDEIVKMGSHKIHFYSEISLYSATHSGETVKVTYKRDGKSYTVELEPKYNEDAQTYYYGFVGSAENVKTSFGDEVVHSVYMVKFWIYYTIESLKMLFTGQANVNDLSGPVTIVKSVGESYSTVSTSENGGTFLAIIYLLKMGILLSANLGVVNLIPFPALDGGRLLFMIVEAIRGKKANQKIEVMVHAIGFIILIGLMVLVFANDIRKLFI